MSNVKNLLLETSSEVEVLTEQTEDGKQLFIEGIFAQASKVNGNGRLYERNIMESAISKYVSDYVSKRRALGELNHPENRCFPDPAEAAIIITELKWGSGDDVYGKAKVLNTPKGQIVKGLLEGGFNMGVSTRALGSLKERGGIKYVQDDLMFTAVDVVDKPSGPDCYVNPLSEQINEWVNKNGVWIPAVKEDGIAIDEGLFLEKLEQYIRFRVKNQ